MGATARGVAKSVALVAGVVFAAACADPSPFRIAVVGSAESQLGALLAAEDINAAGGIGGRLLEVGIVNEHPLAAPQQAIVTADSLAADSRILAVVGHGTSGRSLAASQVYNARHVTQIAPTASSPLYSSAGPYSFRMVASDQHQAEFIAERIARSASGLRVAVLYLNNDYGRPLHGFLQRALRGKRPPPVYDEPFIDGEPFANSVGEIVRSLAIAAPDLLVWIGGPEELEQLRTPLRSAMPRLRVFGSDAASGIGADPATLTPFVGDWVVAYTDVTADRPALRSVAARFLPQSGRTLTHGAALTYDAVGILAEAMRSGARDREAIQRFLTGWSASAHVFEGITGPITFDEHGDARPSYVLMEVTAGGMRRGGR